MADSAQVKLDDPAGDTAEVEDHGGITEMVEESGSGAVTDVAEEGDGGDTAEVIEADGETHSAQENDAGQTTPVSPNTKRRSRKRLLWRIGGFLAVFALGVCAVVTWQAINNDNKVLNEVPGTQTTRDPKNPTLVTYNDFETKMRVSFPASWKTRVAGGADVRLIAGPGGSDSGNLMSIRVVSLDTGSSTPPTPANLKPYLDTIVDEPGVTVLQQNQIVMDHEPGWYYVYTFQDGSTHLTGIHAQYFIIRGQQLYSIVFQALPESDFGALAPTYQQVANSIQFY